MTTPRRSIVMATTTPTGTTKAAHVRAKMDIGDEVVAEVNQTRYVGVLRHLGPVHFRPGIFAGLELIGESAGKGKNDGSVDGQQYFACESGNGMFCPSSKVKPTGAAPSSDATARPQSAMSGRSSLTDEQNRPRSSLSIAESDSHRPRSSLALSGRTPSRQGAARPSSALATPTPSGRLPRLLPRKSVADGLADEEGRRRAKTSAEEAAKAEGRITEGSRAHRFLNMSAKELEARRIRSRPSSPDKAASSVTSATVSPLKDSLLGANRTPKVRSSMGSALPLPSSAGGGSSAVFRSSINAGRPSMRSVNAAPSTPSATKARTSLSDMPPPPPSAWRLHPGNPIPKTPRRLSADSGRSRSRAESHGEDDEEEKKRKRGLLEQMELLTPRHPKVELPVDDLVFGNDVRNDVEEPSRSSSHVAEAVVPLSLYEEVNTENNELKAQLDDVKRKSEAELERAKVIAQQEARKEMEEERRVEQEDEQRRRKTEQEVLVREWKEKEEKWQKEEKGLREAGESGQKELRKLQDDHDRAKTEHEKVKEEMDVRLRDSQNLIEKLKQASKTDDEAHSKAQAKELELSQLNERIERLENERGTLLKEIDELKDAGQEAMDIYEREQVMSNERIAELENNMHLLEAHAQEAIASAIAERDDALQRFEQHKQSSGHSTVAAIDRQSLEDQLAQSQKRNDSLEDQLSELTSAMHEEREMHVKRKDGYGEREAKLKADLIKSKTRLTDMEQAHRDARQRIELLEDALEESRTRLESERGELETLRAEAMIMGDTSDGGAATAAVAAADRGVGGGGDSARQTLELNGLRSIVNTLNQELTDVKAREKDLVKQIETYKNERRRLSQESVTSLTSRHAANSPHADNRAELEKSIREAETQIESLERQLAEMEKSKRDEVAKLHQDIAELEALCEATVWRREEQEAKRQELERKVGKLQRQLERLQPQEQHPPLPPFNVQRQPNETTTPASKVSSNGVAPQASAAHKPPGVIPPPNVSESNGSSAVTPPTGAPSAACAECNEPGHTIDDCPYLNDDVLF